MRKIAFLLVFFGCPVLLSAQTVEQKPIIHDDGSYELVQPSTVVEPVRRTETETVQVVKWGVVRYQEITCVGKKFVKNVEETVKVYPQCGEPYLLIKQTPVYREYTYVKKEPVYGWVTTWEEREVRPPAVVCGPVYAGPVYVYPAAPPPVIVHGPVYRGPCYVSPIPYCPQPVTRICY